ncbi:YcnI family protein [Leifsonia sp. ZF2019]|uniref:YcnI family copper-binding membrane protein n=1 Tax=unclassified Leifsonia TaxID=2663824 RepID=UPI001CBFD13A|nr:MULTISPECIES: YcnI family protein [unclassified Leifsonia]UAJ79609.1 YcnI family protein [Leifsonia sp. ZF2019]
MKKTTFAASIAATTTALLLLAAPLAASAHVHVTPDSATPGSYATLTFKVPTESATAGTVKLVVDLPTATPFTSVSYQPIPGWTASVDTETLATPVKTDDGTITEAPVRITWTADNGTQIAPGQFQEFTISAGAVPDTGSILLPTHQYYSDGSVVDWADKTPASGKEPEHPAPTLYVNDPAPAEEGGTMTTQVETTGTTPASTSAGTAATAVSIGLGIGGLALGAIALVISVLALVRRGKVRA